MGRIIIDNRPLPLRVGNCHLAPAGLDVAQVHQEGLVELHERVADHCHAHRLRGSRACRERQRAGRGGVVAAGLGRAIGRREVHLHSRVDCGIQRYRKGRPCRPAIAFRHRDVVDAQVGRVVVDNRPLPLRVGKRHLASARLDVAQVVAHRDRSAASRRGSGRGVGPATAATEGGHQGQACEQELPVHRHLQSPDAMRRGELSEIAKAAALVLHHVSGFVRA